MNKNYLVLIICFLCQNFSFGQYLDEDFEAGLPATWSVSNIFSWRQGTSSSLSSEFFKFPEFSQFMAANDDAAGQVGSAKGLLYSPIINLENAVAPAISFDAFYQGVEPEYAKVLVSIDGGMSWNDLIVLSYTASWEKLNISLSEYSGVKEFQVAFEYNDVDSWGFGVGIDNVEIFEPEPWNAKLLSVDINEYHEPLVNIPIKGVVFNSGLNTINSYDLYWTDGVEVYSENISGVDIEFGKSSAFTHSIPAVLSAKENKDISVWIDNLNGNLDSDSTDNRLSISIKGLSFLPKKKVIVEEGTGTWCGWCPRGFVGLKYMEEKYEDSHIAIAIHTFDPMQNETYDEYAQFSGYPSSLINRIGEFDPSNSVLEEVHLLEMDKASPIQLGIEASLDANTRVLDIQLSAKSAAQINKQLYFNVVITEDAISSNDNTYAQANYYAGGVAGIMGGFELLPDPVPASQMIYDHVAREILGGWLGFENSIPASLGYDEEVTYSLKYTVPEDYNIQNLNIVAMINDEESGHILNGEILAVKDILSSTKDIEEMTQLNVSPNPCSDFVILELDKVNSSHVELVLTDIYGKIIAKENFNTLNGAQRITYNTSQIPQGVYVLSLNFDDNTIAKKIIKQ